MREVNMEISSRIIKRYLMPITMLLIVTLLLLLIQLFTRSEVRAPPIDRLIIVK